MTQDFLRDGQVSIDIFGIARTAPPSPQTDKKKIAQEEPQLASTFAIGEESANFGAGQAFISPPVEVIAPLDKVDATVRRGDSVRVEVVVRTRKVGHFFPGEPLMRLMSGSSLKRSTTRVKRSFTAVKSKIVAAARWKPARTSIAVFNWTNTAIRSTNATRG